MENIKKCRTIWLPSADEAFLDIWGDKAVELRGPRKNSHIYAEMAQSLVALGHEVRPVDVKYKIHNFTMKYRKCKAEQGTGCSPASWKHYRRVHQIIGTDRVNNVDAVVVDSITGSIDSPGPSNSPISPSFSAAPSASFTFAPSTSPALDEASAPAAKTKNSNIQELNETIKTCMTENNKLTAELIEIEKKKVAAIEVLTKSVF
ncbi:uncharacterized protein LOC129250206 [Anastrepha obliqua]|uniref:uncharacterized protein LOC129250206 n=1 Tax=Anastrepha obliqua TaxID=95512 RepID=UPI00240A07D3|nr:uncharacterized protein LOC129250206 [Anastrepha obliqua]